MPARVKLVSLISMIFGALPASAGSGQASDGTPLQSGDRVRVSAPVVQTARVRGTVVAVDDKALKVKIAAENRELEIPRSQIEKLEVSRGKKSHWLAGAGVGALGGALLTIPYCSGWGGCSSDEALGAGAFFAGIGAAGGALIGAIIRTDRWETVGAPAASMSVAPLPGHGVVLTLRLTF